MIYRSCHPPALHDALTLYELDYGERALLARISHRAENRGGEIVERKRNADEGEDLRKRSGVVPLLAEDHRHRVRRQPAEADQSREGEGDAGPQRRLIGLPKGCEVRLEPRISLAAHAGEGRERAFSGDSGRTPSTPQQT